MENIEVNEYVRTKKGQICKVLGIRQEQRVGKRIYGHKAYYLDNHKGSLTPAFIVKHSPNIIDLIEVGDYVNGECVEKIAEPSLANCQKRLIYCNENGYSEYEYIFNNEEIYAIVTHEQFNQVKYEV